MNNGSRIEVCLLYPYEGHSFFHFADFKRLTDRAYRKISKSSSPRSPLGYEFFTLKPLLSAGEAAGYPNVILLHSMTKRFAVPGLRLGFMTANQILLREIRLQRMPWSVNQLAIEAGHYLLRHAGEYHVDISLLLKEKDRLAEALLAIGGMEVWASDTHYMLVQLRMGRAAALKEYLAGECGILIRDASNFEGLNEHFFRIATQTPEENNELIESIKKWTYLY